MVLTSWKSLNFESRAGNVRPSMIILHYTGMKTEEEALQRLCDPGSKVSAHYFINEVGEVLNLVDVSKRAWHAGLSYWEGITDINSHSIGIEIVNPGHQFGYRAFPAVQMRSLTNLCIRLVEGYLMNPFYILGHSDIAPKRKEDPGELFPWKALAMSGVGLWPRTQQSDYDEAQKVISENRFAQLLIEYGYNPDTPADKLVLAFHRHFYPEKFANEKEAAIPDITSAARLLALKREKLARQKA
jgi:N-acetylmuramoyl-L-alanine amidase